MPRRCLFALILFAKTSGSLAQDCPAKIFDAFGAIIRGDTCKKQIALVFTGDEFADGGEIILKTLANQNIRASFFLTGRFYRNPDFRSLIRSLNKSGYYLGPHSDQHLLYNDWTNRDSLLVTQKEFEDDLVANYSAMKSFGIKKSQAVFFIPPYEWYNGRIVEWAKALGVTTINFSPGTRSTADYTYPELGSRYISSEEIYSSIITLGKKDGLNGFILLVHIGVDPRRPDKFYLEFNRLLSHLKGLGYSFVRIDDFLK
jgi:peptidoglycan/xylan/chitin deacetylase (PgdA/CDA1 family)